MIEIVEFIIKIISFIITIAYFVGSLLKLSKEQGHMEEKIHTLEAKLIDNDNRIGTISLTTDNRITSEANKNDAQFSKIYDRLNASDNRVSSIESTVESIKDGQIRIEGKLDRLIERFGDK